MLNVKYQSPTTQKGITTTTNKCKNMLNEKKKTKK